MAVASYTKSGTKATTAVSLDKAVFTLEVKNHELLKEAYLASLANRRQNLAQVKNRGDVSGGGKKPWRQKGTGRARFGSSRNPIWRSGGVAFGPTGNENYTRKINVKAKKLAIRQALSLKNEAKAIKVIESFTIADNKTKNADKLLTKIEATGRILLVIPSSDAVTGRSVSNLSKVKLITANQLNVLDILDADTVIVTKDSLPIISTWLGASNV